MLLFAKSLASPPWTSLRQFSVSFTLLVFCIMGPTGSGLSFNLRLADNGANVYSWILSSWPQSSATSLQTWVIHVVNRKNGKFSSVTFLLFGSDL